MNGAMMKSSIYFVFHNFSLNCGCPSKSASAGTMGASLMKQPQVIFQYHNIQHVSDLLKAMIESSHVPVSIKCRIGVDSEDSFENFCKFVDTVSQSGVQHFVVHARKAFLNGLSPKENRLKPDLRHDYVYRIMTEFPHLKFSINGGIQSLEATQVSGYYNIYFW
jgi:tRNA-dihydrouridine synthase A